MKKIVTVDGEALTVDGEAVETDDEETMSEYNIGAGLRLDAGTNTLSVNAASTVEEGNTNPVMSAAVWELIGNLSDLTTTAKNNLVAAINEARQSGGGGGGGGISSAQIDEIRVLTKSDYDALDEKDARTLYLVEG